MVVIYEPMYRYVKLSTLHFVQGFDIKMIDMNRTCKVTKVIHPSHLQFSRKFLFTIMTDK